MQSYRHAYPRRACRSLNTPFVLNNPVTLTFDLWSHGGQCTPSVCLHVGNLALIDQAVFLLERGPTYEQTDKHTKSQTQRSAYPHISHITWQVAK